MSFFYYPYRIYEQCKLYYKVLIQINISILLENTSVELDYKRAFDYAN